MDATMAPAVPATRYPMNATVMTTGPGVIMATATASRNWWSVSHLSSCDALLQERHNGQAAAEDERPGLGENSRICPGRSPGPPWHPRAAETSPCPRSPGSPRHLLRAAAVRHAGQARPGGHDRQACQDKQRSQLGLRPHRRHQHDAADAPEGGPACWSHVPGGRPPSR